MRPIDADPIVETLKEARKKADSPRRDLDLLILQEMIQLAPTITPPPNDPLTPEELREMDGEKIYVRYIDGFYPDEDGAYFGKFEQIVRECDDGLAACELPLEYYGKTWLAYRRKPEEGISGGS